ncbi:hypothetical protein [Peterkaempfera griseoplana]|uniref:hypothetical protein n=1 Tax=Peterkaempfera griseoplana TaxID=66896 RepID=UPI0006E3DD3C|nr:hypothetical protein [Peterkaempfera griseoplana]
MTGRYPGQPPVPPAVQAYGAPPEVPEQPQSRRSAVGVWLQMLLQPLWLLPYFAVAYVGEESGIREGMFDRMLWHVLTVRRLRLERRGTAEEWERWLDERLAAVGDAEVRAERLRRRGTERDVRKYGAPRGATVVVQRRYYRGIGPRGAAAVAQRRAWAVDWAASSEPYRRLTLRYYGPYET